MTGKWFIVSWYGKLIQSIDLPWDAGDGWGGSLAAPTIANIDDDPDMEIVVGTVNQGTVAYDVSGTSSARILWGTGRGGNQRTGLAPATIFNRGSLDNSTKTVNPLRPAPGAAFTYTIRLINPGPMLPSARVTDTLPSNAYLANNSVSASNGSWSINGSVLTWTGSVSQSSEVTMTYVMTVSNDISRPMPIVNTALIDDDLGNLHTRTAIAVVNGFSVYLPVIMK